MEDLHFGSSIVGCRRKKETNKKQVSLIELRINVIRFLANPLKERIFFTKFSNMENYLGTAWGESIQSVTLRDVHSAIVTIQKK